MDAERLSGVVGTVAQLVERYKGKALTEQDTKNAFVEPILDALGWPKSDLERVRAEYRHTSKYNPVDYALFASRKPVVFVEAKALDKSLEDLKFVQQVLAYAAVAGVSWALLTNGEQWDLFAVFARVDAPQKRFFSTKVTDPDFGEWMQWVSPSRLDGNELERLWRLLFAERVVKRTVLKLFRERDDDLVALLTKRTSLRTTDVVMALEALEPAITAATMEGRMQILTRDVSARTLPPPQPTKEPEPVPKPATHRKPRRPRTAKPLPNKPTPPAVAVTTPSVASDAEHPLTEKPPSWRKPSMFRIGGSSWHVRGWIDVLMATIGYVRAEFPTHYDALFEDKTLRGRKSPTFSRSPDLLRLARPIEGGFVEAHWSAFGILRLSAKVLAFFGVDTAQAYYTLADK